MPKAKKRSTKTSSLLKTGARGNTDTMGIGRKAAGSKKTTKGGGNTAPSNSSDNGKMQIEDGSAPAHRYTPYAKKSGQNSRKGVSMSAATKEKIESYKNAAARERGNQKSQRNSTVTTAASFTIAPCSMTSKKEGEVASGPAPMAAFSQKIDQFLSPVEFGSTNGSIAAALKSKPKQSVPAPSNPFAALEDDDDEDDEESTAFVFAPSSIQMVLQSAQRPPSSSLFAQPPMMGGGLAAAGTSVGALAAVTTSLSDDDDL